MPFVYLHATLFGIWMLFTGPNPWSILTLILSLEAIFLSTFVMIGQNRKQANSPKRIMASTNKSENSRPPPN